MNLQTTLSIYAGGPGSGCQGPNCGRPEGVHGDVREALTRWVTDEEAQPLNALVVKLQEGDLTDPAVKSLGSLAKQAQSEVGKGKDAVKLFRVELPGSESMRQGAVRSYALTEQAAKQYSSLLTGGKAKVSAVWVKTNHIVAYYKQSNAFAEQEQEVLVSTKPLKLGLG